MAGTRRIMISLPSHLLTEVDGIVASEKRTRSEFIREAMKHYLFERRRNQIREEMQKGYMEMAKINLSLSQEALVAENEAHQRAEEMVSGE